MVYQVQPAEATLTAQMGPLPNGYENEGDLRWATSPAQLYIVSPRDQTAVLEITPAMMFQPDSRPAGMPDMRGHSRCRQAGQNPLR
jgi:hypothetical protein